MGKSTYLKINNQNDVDLQNILNDFILVDEIKPYLLRYGIFVWNYKRSILIHVPPYMFADCSTTATRCP